MSGHDVWHMTRAAGVVAYGLLWLSVVLGLLSSTRLARAWPRGAMLTELHEHASLLALGFSLLHAGVLLADPDWGATALELVLPFARGRDRVGFGLGQLALELLAVVTLSFYVRKRIGPSLWRALHYASFPVYALALAHAALTGSDGGRLSAYYLVTAGSMLLLLLYRLATTAPLRA